MIYVNQQFNRIIRNMYG